MLGTNTRGLCDTFTWPELELSMARDVQRFQALALEGSESRDQLQHSAMGEYNRPDPFAAGQDVHMADSLADLDLSANRIELARRRLAGRYIDLTSSNPTHQGLLFPADILHAAADHYWATRRYDPDPHGLPAAREAIVRYYDERRAPGAQGRGGSGTSLSVDDVFITASTSEAYSLLFALLASPGDNILAPGVSYPLFEYLAAIGHIELRPYWLDEERGWQIDPDRPAGAGRPSHARHPGHLAAQPDRRHRPVAAARV